MLLHMHPDMETILEELQREGIDCRLAGEGDGTRFVGVRRLRPGMALERGTLYMMEDGCGVPGGPRILCPGAGREALLDALMAMFQRFQAQERQLDELVYRNAGLRELCEAGAALLENPICIHDDWFVMIARSAELPEVLPPDYIMASSREFIPRIIIDDFKDDSEYLETYGYREARLWEASPNQPPCLYMNLREGEIYRGRLLVVRHHRDFRRADYRLTELLAQRALQLLNRKRLGVDRPHRSADDIVYDLLEGRDVPARDAGELTRMLGWNQDDPALCIRMRSQQPSDSILMAHALHSELFRAFPQGYILFSDTQQCVVLNLSREEGSLADIRHRLAPLCRDYCLYAGLSAPVTGIREWTVAWREAGYALEKAFALRSDRWLMPFPECALDSLLDSIQPPIRPIHLVAPELLALMAHDAAHDTRYFETLRAYLLLERDIPRTAERLIIHRTTLLYRLRKIRELVPVNLDDPWKRLYLIFSLKILKREEKNNGPSAL